MSPLVNNVPLVHALPRWSAGKVVWHLYLLSPEHYTAAGNTHRPDNSSATEVKYSSQGYALSLAWSDPTARLASLASYPGFLDFCLSFREAYFSDFFPCLSTASDQWWGKNVQATNLGDTSRKIIPLNSMYKSSVSRTPYTWLHSLAGLCGL